MQLTPLLDLLLIVIFAQYMEVRIVAHQETERAVTQTNSELEEIQKQLAALQEKLKQRDEHIRTTEQSEYSGREKLGKLFGELFRIPESKIRAIVKDRSPDEAVLSNAEVDALTDEFKMMSQQRPDQIVDHMLTFMEMKKRFDVWELFLHENDSLQVSVGSIQKLLQADEIETPELFVEEFYKLYKSFPQTKSIVLILVSYDDAQLSQRMAITKGLPIVCDRMRQDSNGTVRFEYAVLGFRRASTPPAN